MNTKSDMHKDLEAQNRETVNMAQKLVTHENRLEKTVGDCKYWLDKYTESFKQHDKVMLGLKTEINGRLDNVLDQLNLRVSIEDVTLNFERLNDLLLVKFSQVEDTKESVRDIMAYQKYFYPLQM